MTPSEVVKEMNEAIENDLRSLSREGFLLYLLTITSGLATLLSDEFDDRDGAVESLFKINQMADKALNEIAEQNTAKGEGDEQD